MCCHALWFTCVLRTVKSYTKEHNCLKLRNFWANERSIRIIFLKLFKSVFGLKEVEDFTGDLNKCVRLNHFMQGICVWITSNGYLKMKLPPPPKPPSSVWVANRGGNTWKIVLLVCCPGTTTYEQVSWRRSGVILRLAATSPVVVSEKKKLILILSETVK